MIDWGQMFFGEGDFVFLLEVVIRTLLMYLFALLMVRLMGKRGMAQLTPFEFVIIVALGSAVGDPMFYAEVPLINGFVVIATVVVMQRLLARATRVEPVERFVEGRAFLVVEDGKIRRETLAREGFTKDELFELLRLNGVARLADVERAVIEDVGRLSVLLKRQAEDGVDDEVWSVARRHADGSD